MSEEIINPLNSILSIENKGTKSKKEPKAKKEPKVKKETMSENEPKPLILKVSEKKAISIYGINRFPVTLYKDQLLRLLEHSDQIKEFIKDNESILATKKNKENVEEKTEL